jgi:glycosyltransferase involved in cell wall biosynthesis
LGLARCLANEIGPSNVVLSLRETNAELGEFYEAGFAPLLFSFPALVRLPLHAPWLARDLARHAEAIAALKPTLVLFTMNFPLAWPFIHLLQARGLRVGYVAHDAQPHPGDYAQLWQSASQRLLLHFADRIVTLSDYVTEGLISALPSCRSRIRTLALETILPLRTPVARPAPSGHVRLAFLGRLIRYKGLDVLAEALRSIRHQQDWSLTVAGDGPLADEVCRLFRGWPQVRLEVGWLSKERFDDLLRTHDVLLCPYTEASQSGVVAEALTFALPCLVMPSGALPSQVGYGRAGLVADAVTAQDFCWVVTRVIKEPSLLASLSEGALDLVRERQARKVWATLI